MIVLRGITWEHPRGYDSMVGASRRYGSLHPDVRVTWEQRSLQAFADAPLEALARDHDLLVIDHPHVPAAAAAGLLAPLDGEGFDGQLEDLAAQSVGRSHVSYAHRGHQYGLASDAAAQVSAYRADLIADPPTDWDGVLELASEGRVLWPAKPIDAFSSLVSVSGSHGAILGADDGAFLDDDVFDAAMRTLHGLADAVPPENLGQNPIQIAEALAASERACYSPLLFGYTNYSRAGYRAHRLRYRDVPAGPAGIAGALLGGAGIAVSAESAHLEASRAFALWVAGAEAQRGVYFDAGGQPGNAVAWEDDRLNAETEDFFRGTRATLDAAAMRPRTLGYLAFQDAAGPLITAALRREIDDEVLHARIEQAAMRYLTSDATGHLH